MRFLLLNILATVLYVTLPQVIGDRFWADLMVFSAFCWFIHMMVLSGYFIFSGTEKDNGPPLMKTAFWCTFTLVACGLIAVWIAVPDW